jgi:hypothetical protein
MRANVLLQSGPQLQSVQAGLTYLNTAADRPYDYAYEPPNGEPWQNYESEVRITRIADARSLASRTSLDAEGFELRDAPTALVNFFDEEAITTAYYGEARELALAATGGTRAYVFDHLVRKRESGRAPLTFGRSGNGKKPSANGRIHNDYTEDSGRRRLELVLQDTRAVAAVERYSIVNIWRSIKGPILDTPLAVCDARTVSARDLVCSEVRYPTRTGEIYLVRHARRHAWLYFSNMERHEALIFKQYDSQVSGISRFVPHAAFDLPHTPPDAPLRESIEIRCLVTYA